MASRSRNHSPLCLHNFYVHFALVRYCAGLVDWLDDAGSRGTAGCWRAQQRGKHNSVSRLSRHAGLGYRPPKPRNDVSGRLVALSKKEPFALSLRAYSFSIKDEEALLKTIEPFLGKILSVPVPSHLLPPLDQPLLETPLGVLPDLLLDK